MSSSNDVVGGVPQASAEQSAPATAATGHMREVLAMVLQALDRDAAEGRGIRREMAAELRAAMEAQSAPAGERETYEQWKADMQPYGFNGVDAFQAGAAWQRTQSAANDSHDFKNFHRLLCERFGYTHDEKDWRRDQLSLIEWVAKQSARVPDVSAMARVLSDRSADACNIDRTDNWAMYGQEYIEDVQAMLAAAPAQPAAQGECCHEFVPFQPACVKCGKPYDSPAAQDQGEVQRLREALEDGRRAMFAVLNQETKLKAVAKRVLDAEIKRIDAALAASTGQEGK